MNHTRQGLIVWFQHRKNIKQIKKHGNLMYVSRKLRYAVLYVDIEDVETIEASLLKFPFVSKVDRSYKHLLKTDYENALPDKAKQYDYKTN
ncbi:YlbG family protein [Pseudogracilibacillus sp. ICA-222130]|uniref:YlbG family protein n=1 Tax=Pseudogracilibacillus sp. ICA-222130 TaxID=3134655 RepID=UPI0030C1DFCB